MVTIWSQNSLERWLFQVSLLTPTQTLWRISLVWRQEDFHCEVSEVGLQLQHEDLPHENHWTSPPKVLRELTLKCEFSVNFTSWKKHFTWRLYVIVVWCQTLPHPETHKQNKVNQSKPIAVVQWQETSLWQTKNMSGDISRLVRKLIGNEGGQAKYSSRTPRINFSGYHGAVIFSNFREVKGQSDQQFCGASQPAVYPAWYRHWRLTSNIIR